MKLLGHCHVGMGYFRVLKLGGHWEMPQRGDHPSDKASAYWSS